MSESVARIFLYIECQNLVTKESEFTEQTNSCVVLHSLGLNFYCLKKIVHRIVSPYERHFLIGLVPKTVCFMIT